MTLPGNPNCAACPFAVDGKPNKPVLGVGPKEPIGIVVGELPSQDDVENQELLTGLLGKQFDFILAQNSLAREKLFIVPAIACHPNPNVEKSLENLKQAGACCKPLLLHQLRKFSSALPILGMGKFASVALLGKDVVFKGRGFLREVEIDERNNK